MSRQSEAWLAQALRNPNVRVAADTRRPSGRSPAPLAPDRERVTTPAGVGAGAAAGTAPRGASKYRNVKRLGPNFLGASHRYDSIWGAEVACQLAEELDAGLWRRVMPEVSVIVGYADDGRPIRHRVDFACLDQDWRLVVVEAKGLDLPAGRAKRGVLAAWGVPVEVRKRPRALPAARRPNR